MSETLLDIVQTAAGEVLVPVSTQAVGSTDEIAQGLLALANATGRDLVRRAEWGALVTLATMPTAANQSDYPLPTDYFRMVDDTVWDLSTHWSVGGPLSPAADRFIRSSLVGVSAIWRRFRLVGRSIRLTPTPVDASGMIVFEYLSRNWCLGSGANAGKTAAAFALDTDTTVFDFDLMVKGVKWRWMAAKGQDAVELRAEYEDALTALIAADQGGGALNFSGPWAACDGDGQAFAATSPNFRISTGSGANILID